MKYCIVMSKWSPPLILLLRSHIFGYESWSHLECLSFLWSDSSLAILSSASCFSIGHTKDIISLDSSVNSTITWNGGVERRWLILRFFNSVEGFKSILISLFWLCSADSSLIIHTEKGLLVSIELLLLNDFISLICVYPEELINCGRWNRLLQVLLWLLIFLPSWMNLPISELQQFGQ